MLANFWNESTVNSPNEGLIPNLEGCKMGLLRWSRKEFAEEIKWKQGVKAVWLVEGDQNTALFHAKASQLRRTNQINRIRDENGQWCDDKLSVQWVIQRYFHNIFTSMNPSNDELDQAINVVPVRVSNEIHYELLKEFITNEIWHYTQNGSFSVKSAYYMACGLLAHKLKNGHTQSCSRPRDWMGIWNSRVPNKVKVFLWRACNEATPTMANLLQHKCSIEVGCLTCGATMEHSKHVFLDCSFAWQAWALTDLQWSVISLWQGGMEDLIRNVRLKLENEDFNFSLIMSWMLWNRRNKQVMENHMQTPLQIVLSAHSFIEDFHNSVIPSKHQGQCPDQLWSTPAEEFVKIKFDATLSSDPTAAGVGAIARDQRERCIAWRTAYFSRLSDPARGEALAARLAVDLCLQWKWGKCIIEGDCIEVIRKLVTSPPSVQSSRILVALHLV
ncbi:hypothetical protein Salat_0636300 [Sesamum alatum]|uniref:Reverse transcriptase zinc-binding domain-containing protein n=1 Tax=Sesamum alatum TaxID=300844 RepID=A0AAE2CU96_9LAMI|nr:hypothetical protein Salat_0636300 [Sesamum alatum]